MVTLASDLVKYMRIWLAICRTFPNASLAVKLLKQIAAKHPDLLLQGMGSGVEAACKFHSELRKYATGALVAECEQAVVSGFCKIYTEILFFSKIARASLLQALTKRFEGACDLNTPEEADLDLLYMCSNIAASLPLKKLYEVMQLLQPAVRMINTQGDSILAAMKEQLHNSNSGMKAEEKTSLSKICGAMVCLLLMAKTLVIKYSLTGERLAALEVTEKRKSEEQKDVQIHPVPENYVGDASNLGSEVPAVLYDGLKKLLLEFTQHHSYLSIGNSPVAEGQLSEKQGIPSPPGTGAATPTWALPSAGLPRMGSGKLPRGVSTGKKGSSRVASRRKSNLSKSVPDKVRKRKKSRFTVGSESDDDSDDEYSKPVTKRAGRARQKLEDNLSDS
jgi:hypothetical protein